MHPLCSRPVDACACVRFNIQVHYLLEQLVVLIESSSSNQVQLCKHRLIRVLLNEFQEVLKVQWARRRRVRPHSARERAPPGPTALSCRPVAHRARESVPPGAPVAHSPREHVHIVQRS